MTITKSIIILSLGLLAGAGAEEEGFVPLFNGKGLTGWKVLQGTAEYKVDGDTILGTTAVGSPNSFLCTEKQVFFVLPASIE